MFEPHSGLGKPADRIEKRPPQKNRVVADPRWIDPHRLELGEDGCDRMGPVGGSAPDEVSPIGQKREPGSPAPVHVANAHGRFASARGLDQPIEGNLSPRRVTHVVRGLPGDVAALSRRPAQP